MKYKIINKETKKVEDSEYIFMARDGSIYEVEIDNGCPCCTHDYSLSAYQRKDLKAVMIK